MTNVTSKKSSFVAKPPESWPESALVSYQPKNYPAASSGVIHVQPTLAQKEDQPSERNWKVSSKGSRDVDGSSMKLPPVGVKLVSDLSGHVEQVRQQAVSRPRHCAVHLTGVFEVHLKDQVAVGEGALCELKHPRLGREDNHTELTKGEAVHRSAETICCDALSR